MFFYHQLTQLQILRWLTISELGSEVRSVLFTPDGKRIISGSGDGVIRIWNATTGNKLMTLFGHDGDVFSLALSSDGSRIFSAGWGLPKVWDAASGAELMTFPVEGSKIAFCPDGKTVATTSDRHSIMLWQSGQRLASGSPE